MEGYGVKRERDRDREARKQRRGVRANNGAKVIFRRVMHEIPLPTPSANSKCQTHHCLIYHIHTFIA